MFKLIPKETAQKLKGTAPFISMLLTMAVLCVTCAAVLYRNAADRSHYRKWKDYDDCGIS